MAGTSGLLTRRTFLATSTTAMLTAPLATGADPMGLDGDVDAHSHIWSKDVVRYPLADGQPASKLAPPSFSAEELLALVRPHGVSRVVLIQHKPYFGVDNSYLADVIAAFPGVFSGVACIAAEAARPEAEMVRLKKLGFRGFRIRPGEGAAPTWKESAGIRAMCRCAADENMAICPLIGPDDITQVHDLCREYPKTTFVVDHLARVGMNGDFPEADVEKLLSLASQPLVNVKVSAFYFLGRKTPPYRDLVPLIRRVFNAFGPDRLMWGSDCPYQLGGGNTYPASLELVRVGLDFLSARDRQALLKNTATRIFFSN